MTGRRIASMLALKLCLAAPALAVPGATDRVPASSLLVPFFETGLDVGTHPHDTIMVVNSFREFLSRTVHYHVWDIDGTPTDLHGNVTLGARASWSVAMRDLLNSASPAVRAQLTEGSFYRGFVTIDAVTAPTVDPPTEADFPFLDDNVFEGWIYYTRLSQGSANGIAMVPLESVPEAADVRVKGFYRGTDNREEIDASGRRCASRLIVDPTLDACPLEPATDGPTARIHLRVFRSAPLSGSSRAVVFTWVPGSTGGPSMLCDDPGNSCSSEYIFRQYTEAGAVVTNTTLRLDHVVNIIENSALSGDASGWISIYNVPNVLIDLQVYGLSFNSASPSGDPDLTWDAIFEAYVLTDPVGFTG